MRQSQFELDFQNLTCCGDSLMEFSFLRVGFLGGRGGGDLGGMLMEHGSVDIALGLPHDDNDRPDIAPTMPMVLELKPK